jgi:hypothetical protein
VVDTLRFKEGYLVAWLQWSLEKTMTHNCVQTPSHATSRSGARTARRNITVHIFLPYASHVSQTPHCPPSHPLFASRSSALQHIVRTH